MKTAIPSCAGAGQLPAVYSLPVGAIIMVKDGEQVLAGDIIARKPRETSKTRDIVGGLPRVAELFEVRKPKDMAVVSEIAGTVSFAGEAKGKRKLIVTPEVGESKEYLVPKGKHITVSDGRLRRVRRPADRRQPRAARHPAHQGREVPRRLPGGRNPGSVPLPGRGH